MQREPQIFTTGQTTSKNGIAVAAILLIKKKKMQHSQVTHCGWLISSPLNTGWDVLHCKSVRYEQTPVALRTTTQVIQSHTKAPKFRIKGVAGSFNTKYYANVF